MFGFGVRPEMDALGKRRSNRITFNNDEVEQTLNQLLASMDGLVANKGMVVLAATNRCARSAPCLSRRSQAERAVSRRSQAERETSGDCERLGETTRIRLAETRSFV